MGKAFSMELIYTQWILKQLKWMLPQWWQDKVRQSKVAVQKSKREKLEAGVISPPPDARTSLTAAWHAGHPPSPCLVRRTQNLTSIQKHPWFRQRYCQLYWQLIFDRNRHTTKRGEIERQIKPKTRTKFCSEHFSFIWISGSVMNSKTAANWLKLCENWWMAHQEKPVWLSQKPRWKLNYFGLITLSIRLAEKPEG